MSGIFTRTEMMIGRACLQKLAGCRVAVVGLGGVGSFAAEALARAGIGSLVLVDYDHIEISNINRQLHALHSTVGKPKARVMMDRLRDINPALAVQAYDTKFCPATAGELLDGSGRLDYVIDAIDDVTNKVTLITCCLARNLPVISVMGTGNRLDPTSFKVGNIWNTSTCPLARAVRKKLRAAGINGNVPVVFSADPPGTAAGHRPAGRTRAAPGSISFVPPVAGLLAAGYVIDNLLNLGVFSGG